MYSPEPDESWNKLTVVMMLITSELVVRLVQKYRQRLRPTASRQCTLKFRNSVLPIHYRLSFELGNGAPKKKLRMLTCFSMLQEFLHVRWSSLGQGVVGNPNLDTSSVTTRVLRELLVRRRLSY